MTDPRIPHDGERTTARLSGGAAQGDAVPAHPAHDQAESDAYSATALGSQWFERPDPEPAPEADTLVRGGQPASVTPDRVEGEVLRFGPGVTAAVQNRNRAGTAAALWHGTLPGQPAGPQPPRGRHRGGLRRYALAATVLVAVLAFLAWQRHGPALAVEDVTVHTAAEGPGCDGTADVVGVVGTNGRPGTVTYRWVRSDGTSSGLLRETVTRGQKQARLHLLWTFRGRGEYLAGAELRVTSPSRHTVATQFRYRCL
jgi:hypothetical protein